MLQRSASFNVLNTLIQKYPDKENKCIELFGENYPFVPSQEELNEQNISDLGIYRQANNSRIPLNSSQVLQEKYEQDRSKMLEEFYKQKYLKYKKKYIALINLYKSTIKNYRKYKKKK